MNCLDPAVAVSVQFTTKAFADLPVVTEQDYRRGLEKYRTLIGKVFREGRGFRVVVHHVYDFDSYYEAGFLEIRQSEFDVLQIRNTTRFFSRVLPKFRGMDVVGHFHTHPLFSDECRPTYSCAPSTEDYLSLCKCYDLGLISKEQPYLYGIGGLMDNGGTGYEIYHLKGDGRNRMFCGVNWLTDVSHP